ncbi:MAG: methylmalonyl-CoA epimerase [Thermoleophilia bacterium]|nr:methylmalonyl-CoA epimerase [Thermoleophilia bacterium]
METAQVADTRGLAGAGPPGHAPIELPRTLPRLPAAPRARRRRPGPSGRRLGRTPPVKSRDVEGRGIHHLGVAVGDLDEALGTYERLFGAELEHRRTVPEQGVEAAAVLVGDGRVELLAALDADTPVGRFLAKRGPGMHHVAFEVSDLRAALAALSAAGAELIDPEPRAGLFGMEVAFVHPDSVHGVLAEVVARG